MIILDWVFIIALSFATFFISIACMNLFLRIGVKKKLVVLSKKRPKHKQNRKKWFAQKNKLTMQRKKYLVYSNTFLVLALFLGGLSYGSLYYQSIRLNIEDSSAVVKGYYLLRDIENEMKAVQETKNYAKISKNIQLLSAQLSSYGIQTATIRNTIERQTLLNKYYKYMKELGVNLSTQPSHFFNDTVMYNSFMSDIKKIKSCEKDIFELFSVNEQSLEKKE